MGVRERKEREREQRRFDILESARVAFGKHGLEHTSMDRIAQEAELAKGTLYLYFKNRDELLMALLVHDFGLLIDEIEATVAKRTTPQEKLISIPGCFHDFSGRNQVFYLSQPIEMVVMEMMLALKGAMVIVSNGMVPPALPLQDLRLILHNMSCMFIRSLESPNTPACSMYLFGDHNHPLPSMVKQ